MSRNAPILNFRADHANQKLSGRHWCNNCISASDLSFIPSIKVSKIQTHDTLIKACKALDSLCSFCCLLFNLILSLSITFLSAYSREALLSIVLTHGVQWRSYTLYIQLLSSCLRKLELRPLLETLFFSFDTRSLFKLDYLHEKNSCIHYFLFNFIFLRVWKPVFRPWDFKTFIETYKT